MSATLLSRDAFREGVFARDGHCCVICGRSAPIDAHHIMERRLFDDGGYYLDNGATLCDGRQEPTGFYEGCHVKAERTFYSCDKIRGAAGIRRVILPEHLYDDHEYDKWGNVINADGTRTKGELFGDESVQKVLSTLIAIDVFTDRVKYPRTYHLPWSPGTTDDDRTLPSTHVFEGRRVIVTEKMDGENTSLYSDYMHARSIDSGGHPSRGWVKNMHGGMCHDIPEGWRICGENLYARHTLHYLELPTYFMVFSIWNENNLCLSWDETVEYAALLDFETVPVLYDGIWNDAAVRKVGETLDLEKQEGYVVRVADAFPYGSFRRSVAKLVRAKHVGTAHNWMRQTVVPNGLRKAMSRDK